MPLLRTVQRRIEEIERFRVRFRHLESGRDVRDDLRGVRQYPYERMARNTWRVAGWKRARFKAAHPAYEVDVLNVDGSVADGRTALSTVRDTYLD